MSIASIARAPTSPDASTRRPYRRRAPAWPRSSEPATRANVLSAYEAALKAHPRTKLLLLTHLNNKTGLIIPVKEIVAMARARGIDVIVDAAHSFGQCDLRIGDLGA